MARKSAQNEEATEAEATEAASSGNQGRKVILPNGEARVDFIRRRFYDEGATRSEIRKELCELTGEDVVYQIVFAATKEKEKPVPKPRGPKTTGEGEGEGEADAEGDDS